MLRKRAQAATTSSLDQFVELDSVWICKRIAKAQEKPGKDKNVRIVSLYGGFRLPDCTIVSDVAGWPGGQEGSYGSGKLRYAPRAR